MTTLCTNSARLSSFSLSMGAVPRAGNAHLHLKVSTRRPYTGGCGVTVDHSQTTPARRRSDRGWSSGSLRTIRAPGSAGSCRGAPPRARTHRSAIHPSMTADGTSRPRSTRAPRTAPTSGPAAGHARSPPATRTPFAIPADTAHRGVAHVTAGPVCARPTPPDRDTRSNTTDHSVRGQTMINLSGRADPSPSPSRTHAYTGKPGVIPSANLEWTSRQTRSRSIGKPGAYRTVGR